MSSVVDIVFQCRLQLTQEVAVEIRDAADVASILRSKRLEKGLSQQQLAQRLGVSRQWVVGAEGGAPTARLELVLRALHEVGLGVNVYDDESDAIYEAVLKRLR
jgi:HTH-type transcriptional regulator/antitoxin HipB